MNDASWASARSDRTATAAASCRLWSSRRECRGTGIGSQIVRALLAREAEPVYLFCREQLTPFYARFGFDVAEGQRLPRGLARMLRLGNLMSSTEALFSGHHTHIVAMRRDLPMTPVLPVNAPPAI